MTKKIRKRKANYFNNGGFSWNKDISFGKNMGNAFNSGALNGAITGAGSMLGQGISGGLSNGVGSTMQGLGSIAGMIPGPWGGIAGAGLNVVGGLVNRFFGSSINKQALQEAKSANTQQSNRQFDVSSTADLLNQSNFNLLGKINRSDIGKDGLFSNKVKNLTAELNRQRDIANQQAIANFGVAADNLEAQNDFNSLANYAAFGGRINNDFTNGIIQVNEGGTHEENPMEGVPMGMDAQGVPNLVEEGEVIWNNYVFSDRINVPNSIKLSLGLSKSKDITFAKAAKKLSKESEERPNDPISKRGLFNSMTKLQQTQEMLRQQKQSGQEGIQYAHGGKMGKLFAGLGPYSNYLGVDDEDNNENNFVGYTKRGVLTEDSDILGFSSPEVRGTSSNYTTTNNSNDYDITNNNVRNSGLSWLRYAHVAGAALGIGQNLFSKPDYSSSDAILNAANDAGIYTPVGFNPLGDYLVYRPFDRNYYINKLNAQSSATKRAIVNQSAGNRATALAGLLAADYNSQNKLGDLARQAEEYNLSQRERVATFNRGTNQFNSEMGLKAAMANQEASLKAKNARLSGVTQAMAVRDAVDARRDTSMSANLTNFFNSLGDIGREEVMKSWINENPALYYAISTGGAGTPYKGKKKDKKSKGGYLTIKSKKK